MFVIECQKFHTRFLICSLIALTLLFASGCQSLDSHLKSGENLLKQRRYPEAEMQFRAAVEINDTSADAHWGLARTYEAQGKFLETTAELKRVSELAPGNLEAKVKLGNYYLLFSPPQIRESEITLDDILQRDPKYIEAHILRASILSTRNQPEAEVMSSLDYAISLDPKRTESYVAKSRYLMKLQKGQEAEVVLKQGIAANPNNSLGYVEYARYLAFVKRPEEAEAQFAKAVQVNPKDVVAWEAFGSFYVSLGLFDKAEKTYQDFVKSDGNSAESRVELAEFYASVGRDKDAIGVYEGILKQTPDYARARYSIAEIYIQQKNYEKANAEIDKLLAANGSDPAAMMLRARLAIEKGDSETAIADLEEVLKKAPSNRDALFYMAQARLASGQTDQAQTFINDLDKFHPGFRRTALLKIQLAFANNNPEVALQEANKLISSASDAIALDAYSAQENEGLRVRGITSRGMAEMMLGNLDRAEADLAEVVKLSPNSASAKMNLARVYTAKGDLAKSMELYDAALQNDPDNLDALSGAVDILTRQKDFANAKARIDAASKKYGKDKQVVPALHYMKSDVFRAEGNSNAAIAELQQAMQINPDFLPAYSAYASILFDNKQADAALQQYQKIVEKKPSAPIYALMGMVQDAKGDSKSAEANYRKALELSPNNAIAANNLAWLIADSNRGNLDEALKLAQDNVNRNKNVAGFYDTLSYVNFKKGFYPQATEASKQAVALDENDARTNGTKPTPGYRLRLGMAMSKSGDPNGGKQEIASAVRSGSNTLTQKEVEQAKNVLAGK